MRKRTSSKSASAFSWIEFFFATLASFAVKSLLPQRSQNDAKKIHIRTGLLPTLLSYSVLPEAIP
jgi:hypothetical protein